MQRSVTSGYVFSPSQSGAGSTVDLSAIAGASIGTLLGIFDKTQNVALYTTSRAGFGGTWSGSVLTLQASTLGCVAGDVLQVMFDDGALPAEDATVAAVTTQLKNGVPVSGTVQATGGTAAAPVALATDATAQAILAALKAQINIADLTYTDGAGNFYIRREAVTEGTGALTITWENPDGTAANPASPNTLKPASGTSRVVETVYYDATAAGTGYAAGDILARVVITDVIAQAIVATIWHDITTGTTLASAPTAGTFVAQSRDVTIAASALPANAAQEAGGNLAALATAFGSASTAAAASDGASAPFVGLFRRSLSYLASLASTVSGTALRVALAAGLLSTTATGTVSAAASNVTLAVDGYNAVSIQLLGTWSGTLTFQGSPDGGTTYYPVSAIPYSGGTSIGTATGTGLWELAVGGLTHIQVVAAAALSSGSATVNLRATSGQKSLRVGTANGNPLLTTGTATAFADRSGTTSSTANAFTSPFAANAARQFARVSNPASNASSATLYVWDKVGTPTIAGSVPLAPGQSITWDAKVPSNAIQVAAAGASIAFEGAEG